MTDSLAGRHRPIVIVTTGRAGSSMTARIFAAHGAWTGKCDGADRRNPHGYYENRPIKRKVQELEAGIDLATDMIEPVPWWRAYVEREVYRQGYRGGPWAVKSGAVAWQLWQCFDPVWVLPRRDLGEVFGSLRLAGFARQFDDATLREGLRRLDAEMDRIRDDLGGIDVDSAAVVGGDYRTIRAALEAASLTPDDATIADAVDPTCWHGAVAA